jgi:hypothetical protein
LGSAGGPAAALFGIGSAGGIIATVAAVGQLASAWAVLGFDVLRTSSLIGMNAQELQKWQGAARLAGVSAEEMTSSLGNLAKTQQDARYGRNVLAAQVMRGFGINTSDPSKAMSDLFRASAGMTPQTRIKLFESMGVSPALIPMGRKNIGVLKQEAQARGMILSPDELDAAEKVRLQALGFGGTASGVANKVGGTVGPVIGEFADDLGNALSQEKRQPLPGMNRDNRPAFVRSLSGATQKQQDDMRAAYGRDHGANPTKVPVEITVRIPNAPGGTEVEASADGRPLPVRISMPEE